MVKNNQKGISLLITLLIMSALLSIAFGLSVLSLGEVKLSREDTKSLTAYYAAEAGVECQMFNDRLSGEAVCGGDPDGNGEGEKVCLDTGQIICYKVQVSGSYFGGNPPRTIKSDGSYRSVRRAIELTY